MNYRNQQRINHKQILSRYDRSNQKILRLILFIFSLGVTVLILWVSTSSIAQGGVSVSGRLIDTKGNAIQGVRIYLRYDEGPNQKNRQGSDDSIQTKTDTRGRFAFTDYQHNTLQLGVDGSSKTGFYIKVLSVEFGKVALYPFRGLSWSSVKFVLDPGTKMENIIITAEIKERQKYRARVVYADSTPLVNTRIYAYRKTNEFFRSHAGYSQFMPHTDAEGYFFEYLNVFERPEYYITLAVEHQGLYAKATPFILKGDADIVLTLDGNPGTQTDPVLVHSQLYSTLDAYLEPAPVWVVNPANGHSYKITHSQTIKDALAQANTEGAYLVAINDEAEEKWLNRVYGNKNIWIGLSDVEEEGKWKWQSGEPVNYTNWVTYEAEGGNTDGKDYVRTGHLDWGWNAIGEFHDSGNSQNPQLIFARTILEKKTTPIKTKD